MRFCRQHRKFSDGDAWVRFHPIPGSGGSRNRSYPPEQEEVVAAQLASERQQEPVDCPFEGIPDAHAAELDGSTERTVACEHA